MLFFRWFMRLHLYFIVELLYRLPQFLAHFSLLLQSVFLIQCNFLLLLYHILQQYFLLLFTLFRLLCTRLIINNCNLLLFCRLIDVVSLLASLYNESPWCFSLLSINHDFFQILSLLSHDHSDFGKKLCLAQRPWEALVSLLLFLYVFFVFFRKEVLFLGVRLSHDWLFLW